MWPFTCKSKPEVKDEEKPAPEVPKEYLESFKVTDESEQIEIRTLLDKATAKEGEGRNLARFLLWQRLGQLYPQVREWQWVIDATSPWHIIFSKQNPGYQTQKLIYDTYWCNHMFKRIR